jgi:transcriptional regulator with XRE-family HTH domain
MEEPITSIRHRVRNRRMEMDVSQRWLSEQAGANVNYVNHLENGLGPLQTIAQLMELARVMNVRFCWLITGQGPKRVTP